MGNIGITGCNGFVAKWLCRAILEKGLSYEGIDRHGYNSHGFHEFVKDKEVIFHLAGVNRSDTEEGYIKGNFELTKELVSSIKKFGKKSCRIIFSSTVQVYGNRHGKIDEKTPPMPLWAYSQSKLKAEKEIIGSGLDYVVFRISNVYGPGAKPFYNSVIATFIHLAKNNKPLLINGTGEQVRDYIFVSDVTNALLHGMSIQQGVYNLSTGKLTSLNEVVEAIRKILKKELVVQRKEIREEIIRCIYDNSKLTATGWRPEYTFEEGIKKCLIER
ncbi:MAG: NAD(P)-dependent oxidoreductase [Candidatus Woesearchaeota archaeon]